MSRQNSIEIIETNFEDNGINEEDQQHIPSKETSVTQKMTKSKKSNLSSTQSSEYYSSVSNNNSAANIASETNNDNIQAPIAKPELEDVDSPSDGSDQCLLRSPVSTVVTDDDKVNGHKSNHSLVSLSKIKVYPADNDYDDVPIEDETSNNVGKRVSDNTQEVVATIHSFFAREWNAFKKEKTKKLRQIPKKVTNIDFEKLIKEFKNEGDEPERHWTAQAVKKEGEKCPELLSTILVGICFTLIPNCAIVLDYITASEYIGGNYYLKYDTDNISTNTSCRSLLNGYKECLEYDPVYGGLTLAFTFISGIFWSVIIFYRLWTYLTESDSSFYNRKRMLVFFFSPLALICIVTFPLQLLLISIVATFNDQDQWILLTTRIGIAEGLFNAHFQFLLQLFVFFTRADRHPSTFQYLTAFGSLVFLAYSRVESLMLDRGGHRMSPGQKVWWVIRYGPSFLLNCAFKLGSISLIIAMLRFNSIWLYGSVILIWSLLQILFNELVIDRRWYYLFLGAGMHAVTVAHIPEYVKLIDTDPDIKNNVLWSTKLSSSKLRSNLRFQNGFWFLFNSIIIITLWIVSSVSNENTQIPLFWPFTPENTYTFKDNKVFGVLNIVAPIILIVGLISQIILWCFEERPLINIKRVLSHEGVQHQPESYDTDIVDAPEAMPRRYEGWSHVQDDQCPGCVHGDTAWHKHVYDDTALPGAQGKFNQIIYPLLNIWENFGDKNTTQT